MSAIAASFTDKSEPKAVISNGVKINGEKYMTIEASDDSLKAKKVSLHPSSPRTYLVPMHLSNIPQAHPETHNKARTLIQQRRVRKAL
jgi:hypothetical protein